MKFPYLNTIKWTVYRIQRALFRLFHRGRKDTRASINLDKNLAGRFCQNPFTQFDIYEDGKAYSCCNAWLPTPIGNLNHSSVMEVWNSQTSLAIRQSIIDGSFRYCDHKICPAIQSGSLPSLESVAENPRYRDAILNGRLEVSEPPRFINLCNDASCNLYCPSCRSKRINYPAGPEYEKRQHLQDILEQDLFSTPSEREFTVSVTGSGDPFASAVFRKFLYGLKGHDFPNLAISLQTNGVLLTERSWIRMQNIHDNIQTIIVSFDAATQQTYEQTRRGGNWDRLLENTARLGELRQSGELRLLRLDFVVQKANYREMPDFVRLGRELNADSVMFSMILDWSTWPPATFREQCIWRQDHPEFEQFLAELRDPVFDDPFADLGNISEYRTLALKQN